VGRRRGQWGEGLNSDLGTHDIKYSHHEITGGTENKKYRSKLER
jgi:hypothetical protein